MKRMQHSMQKTRGWSRGARAAGGIVAVLAVALALGAADAAAQSQGGSPSRVRAASPYGPPGGGWLGVGVDTRMVRTADGVQQHIVITRVEPGSPAARAGLQTGDAVVLLNGEDAAPRTFHMLPFTLAPGDTVRFVVQRQDRNREVAVVAAERPGRYMLAWAVPVDTVKRLTIELIDSARMAAVTQIRLRGELADSLRQRQRSLEVMLANANRQRAALGDSLARLNVSVAELMHGARAWWFEADTLMSASWQGNPFSVNLAEGWGGLRLGGELRAPDIHYIQVVGERGVAGAEFAELNPGLARYFEGAREGLLTLRVAPAAPAARAGLEPGDVVVSAQGRPVRSIAELRSALLRSAGTKAAEIHLEIIRNGERRMLRLRAEPL